MDFSIICIYNNEEKLKSELQKSLEKQKNVTYETIFIDNTNQKYRNAKDAFCYATEKATGKYFMFLHQDIIFEHENTLETIYNILEKNNDFGIAGVAGQCGNETISNIFHGKDRTKVSNTNIDQIKQVDTVDECLFVIKKDLYKKITFDNLICEGWHLYAVEYSLLMRKNGQKVIVIPIELYHKSKGRLFQ